MECGERDVKGAGGGETLWEQPRGLLRIHWATVPVRPRKGSTGVDFPSLQVRGGKNRQKKKAPRKNSDLFYTVTIFKSLLSHHEILLVSSALGLSHS